MEHTADEMLEHCRAMMHAHDTGADGVMSGMPMEAGMLLAGLLWLALSVVISLTVVWVLQRRGAAGNDSEARRSLDLRYAQGEVDRDTYLRMRADLADGASGAR